MKTKIIKVRRQRPSGVVWAISLMLLSLAFYLITSAPPVLRQLTVQTEDNAGTPVSAQRITQDINFPAVSMYLLQFGAFTDAENARIEASRYVKRGAAGYIMVDELYRVIGAEYATREEAERVRDMLKEREGMDCQINAVGSEVVALRVTATEAQIGALKGGIDTVTEALNGARALAYTVDGGEVTKEGAQRALKTYADRVSAARQALSEQAGEAPNDVAKGLITLLEKTHAALESLSEENPDNILSFSGKIKYNTIQLRLEQVSFLKKLAA